MKHYYIIIILAILLVPAALADSTNKTIYYKIYPNQTMEVYDKGNFSISLNGTNDSVERSFTIIMNYNATMSTNMSSGDLTVYCGDTTFTCPTITIPADPACPSFPTIPAAPACPACPALNDEVAKDCMSTINQMTSAKPDYTPYIITGVLVLAIIGLVYLLKTKTEGEGRRPIVVQKANNCPAPIEKPKPQPPQKPQTKLRPPKPSDDGNYFGEYDDLPQAYKPDFDIDESQNNRAFESKKAIEELRQPEPQQQEAQPRRRKTLEEYERDMEEKFGGQNARR